MNNQTNDRDINVPMLKEILAEFDEIGFGNQMRIPGGKYGAKRVELKTFLEKSISKAVKAEREKISNAYIEAMLEDGRLSPGLLSQITAIVTEKVKQLDIKDKDK